MNSSKYINGLLSIFIMTTPVMASTWYVSPTGGTRYSTHTGAIPGVTGLCDGTSPSDPVGTTPNQHCAFNDVRYLWTDGTSTTNPSPNLPAWGWIGTAEDTYIIAQNISGGVDQGWRTGQNGSGNNQGFGLQGDPYDAGAPPPYNNVTIEGSNFASCGTFPAPGQTWTQASVSASKTQIFGGFASTFVIDLRGTTGVTINCLDLTDHGSCVRVGSGNQCSNTYPLSDFAAEGLLFNRTTTGLTLTDVNAHGFQNTGWQGPVGDGFNALRVQIDGNANAGWNADNGDGTTGTGTANITNYIIDHSGCSQQYPIVNSFPYFNCTDDNHGGYGDGFGTATTTSSPAWHVNFAIGEVAYNTQDGLDALHLTGGGSTMSVTRTLAFSNMGNQVKEGAAGTVTNNIIVHNCQALSQAIPGAPSGFNSQLSDYCRAGNEALLVAVNNGSTTILANNTVIGSGGPGDLTGIVCNITCTTTASFIYENNILIGSNIYGAIPARYFDGSGATGGVFAQTGSKTDHNAVFNTSTSCPLSGETNTICVSPQIVSIILPPFGFGNVAPSSGSSNVVGAGVTANGITVDFNGFTRPSPPSIGVLEFQAVFFPVHISGKTVISGKASTN